MRLSFICFVVFVLISPVVALAGEEDEPLQDSGVQVIAVWDFENSTMPGMGGQVDYLVRIVPEMIVSKMVDIPGIKIVERVQLQEVLQEQKLGLSDLVHQKSQLDLGKISGAKFMIFGSFMVVGDMIQVSARVVDVETSLITFMDHKNSSLGKISQLVASLAANVARSFLSARLSETTFSWKQDGTLWKRHDEGLKLLDGRRYADAIRVFEEILKDHPGFSPAQRQIRMAKLGDDYKNGLELVAQKRYAEAVVVFRGILKQDNAFKPARENLKKALRLKRHAS